MARGLVAVSNCHFFFFTVQLVARITAVCAMEAIPVSLEGNKSPKFSAADHSVGSTKNHPHDARTAVSRWHTIFAIDHSDRHPPGFA